VHERAAFSVSVGGEERQLAAASVGTDEREGVGAVDDVHAEVLGHEVRDPITVGNPEGNVIERQRFHRY
jgi:hypothetical protein